MWRHAAAQSSRNASTRTVLYEIMIDSMAEPSNISCVCTGTAGYIRSYVWHAMRPTSTAMP